MVYDMDMRIWLHGMTWRACYGLWYGLACMQDIWYDLAGIGCGMALCAWHGICNGLAGIVWYMVWRGRHRMVGIQLRAKIFIGSDFCHNYLHTPR